MIQRLSMSVEGPESWTGENSDRDTKYKRESPESNNQSKLDLISPTLGLKTRTESPTGSLGSSAWESPSLISKIIGLLLWSLAVQEFTQGLLWIFSDSFLKLDLVLFLKELTKSLIRTESDEHCFFHFNMDNSWILSWNVPRLQWIH